MSNDMKVLSCKTSTAISSLIGGVTSFATSFFLAKFPPRFFKKVYIGDSLNSTNMRNFDILEQSMPYLAIYPSYSIGNTFMELQPLWRGTNYRIFNNKKKKYTPVLVDEENKIFIYSIPDRNKVTYSLKIKLPTQMMAYEMIHYLANLFENNGYNFINKIKLQTEIPKIYTFNICKKLNLDINNKEDREKLSEYLIDHSYNSITQSIDMATGNVRFMYNYYANILVHYPDEPTSDKNIKNLVIDNTNVSFTFSFELWTPSNFIMEINNDAKVEDVIDNDDSSYKYNLVLDTDYIKNFIDGKHLIVRKSYIPDINVEYDELNIEPIMDDSLIEVIKYIVNNKMDMDKFIDVRIFCNNKELFKDAYTIDWSTFILKTIDPMINATYTFLLYGNLADLNNISNTIEIKKK